MGLESVLCDEVSLKVGLLQSYLKKEGKTLCVISRVENFSWLTGGGRSFVSIAAEKGVAQIVVHATGVVQVLTNNIEAPRMIAEELHGTGLEGLVEATEWWRKLEQKEDGSDMCSDADAAFASHLALCRSVLLDSEQERARMAGRRMAEAIEATGFSIQRGQTELKVSSVLQGELAKRGFECTVILIASDERVFKHRHPLPTTKKVEQYVMLVGCCRWKGLFMSSTRLVHFGEPSVDLRKKMTAVVHVDAAMHNAVVAGATLKEVFEIGVAEYEKQGYKDEWKEHHQGGTTGYATREKIATFDTLEKLKCGQLCAFNPSIAGVKSEDTTLVLEDGPAVQLTVDPNSKWPTISAYGVTKADILVRQ